MKATIVLAIISLLVYSLVNTRLGVFLVFDVVGDLTGTDNLASDTENGPLQITRWLSTAKTITAPVNLAQPSGIQVTPKIIWVSTDQAELFKLDHQGHPLGAKSQLLSGPLLFNQGSLEGIWLEGNQLQGIGELGAIARWTVQDNRALKIASTPLAKNIADQEFTGITKFAGRLYAVADTGLAIYDLGAGTTYQPKVEAHLKPENDTQALLLSGISADERYLYVVTEAYPSILVIDPKTWEVIEVLGIDPIEASDVAVHNGLAYITVDHNYFDPQPPIYVYNLDLDN